MKLNLVISLTWAICTAFPSSPPEHLTQSKARTLPNFKSRNLSDRDGLPWTDDIFNTDAITNDADLAPDADTEGFFSEQNSYSSSSSGNDIDGLDHEDSIRDDSTVYLASADPPQGSCSAASHSPSYAKIRLRNDVYCPSTEASPLAPKYSDIPSFPNLLDQIDPRLPIDVPLFNIKEKDDLACPGPGYTNHLCCDGPRGPWVDRWSHYDFVLNCLPCTAKFRVSLNHFLFARHPSFLSSHTLPPSPLLSTSNFN